MGKYSKLIKICKEIYDSVQASEEDKIMLNKYPHIFVLSCVMDSQIDSEKAWAIPRLVASQIGGFEFKKFYSKDKLFYINLFKTKKYHRFNEIMGAAFYEALEIIANKYKGNAANIWNDNPSSAELICRFLEFDRVGVKIATMAANLLSRDHKIKLKDYYAIDISPDIHVKRTMYRLGLLKERKLTNFDEINPTEVIYKAKSINPTFPGLLDHAFWKIGFDKICTNRICNKEKCPFKDICVFQGINDKN